jgi:hypothetical protein
MDIDLIKEKASNKIYSKMKVLEFKIESLKKEVKLGGSGGITLEELESIVEHHESELKTFNYIFYLIEKDL